MQIGIESGAAIVEQDATVVAHMRVSQGRGDAIALVQDFLNLLEARDSRAPAPFWPRMR